MYLYAQNEARFQYIARLDLRLAGISNIMSFLYSYFPGWFFLDLNLRVFLLERMLWKQEKMRRRYGSFGGTATRRFAARVSGNWHKMLKKDRRKTVMFSATTGDEESHRARFRDP